MNFNYGETLFSSDTPCNAGKTLLAKNEHLLQDLRSLEIVKVKNEDELNLPVTAAQQLKTNYSNQEQQPFFIKDRENLSNR